MHLGEEAAGGGDHLLAKQAERVAAVIKVAGHCVLLLLVLAMEQEIVGDVERMLRVGHLVGTCQQALICLAHDALRAEVTHRSATVSQRRCWDTPMRAPHARDKSLIL